MVKHKRGIGPAQPGWLLDLGLILDPARRRYLSLIATRWVSRQQLAADVLDDPVHVHVGSHNLTANEDIHQVRCRWQGGLRLSQKVVIPLCVMASFILVVAYASV